MVLVADPERRAATVYPSRCEIHIVTAGAGDVVPGWKLPVTGLFG
jgi:hypothetical protein